MPFQNPSEFSFDLFEGEAGVGFFVDVGESLVAEDHYAKAVPDGDFNR